VTLVLVGTVTAIAYHYLVGFYWSHGYPETTFLFKPSDRFNDWYLPYAYAGEFIKGGTAPFIYFPLAFLAIAAGTMGPAWVGFALLIAAFLTVLILALRGWVVDCEQHVLTKVQYVFILVVLSYPVLFLVDRTNLDLLMFVLIAGFFYFHYVRESPRLAVLFLASAIAFKLYPATLLLVLLAERRYRSAAATALLAAAMSAAALVTLGALSGRGLMEMVHLSNAEKGAYQQYMVVLGGGLQHGHSLWGLLRLPGYLNGTALAGWETKAYTVLAVLVFIGIAAHIVFREKEPWKRVLLAIAPTVLLPFVSSDYTLIYLYFPLIFFVNAPRSSRWDAVYIVLFALLLIPVDYHYLFYDYVLDGISVSVVVYPLVLLALMTLAILDRPPSARTAGRSGAQR
jgi:hypothetical protein